MKTYKFKIINWKDDHYFFMARKFPSAYYADRYASRILLAKNSPYICVFLAGEEE